MFWSESGAEAGGGLREPRAHSVRLSCWLGQTLNPPLFFSLILNTYTDAPRCSACHTLPGTCEHLPMDAVFHTLTLHVPLAPPSLQQSRDAQHWRVGGLDPFLWPGCPPP